MYTMQVPNEPDYTAPDGSEIRLLPSTPNGGIAHCTLGPGKVSKAVRHKTVEEIWYFVQGEGEVWRKYGQKESVVPVSPGTALVIPFQAHFQFKNNGSDDLVFIVVTIPGWPGPEEAEAIEGKWKS